MRPDRLSRHPRLWPRPRFRRMRCPAPAGRIRGVPPQRRVAGAEPGARVPHALRAPGPAGTARRPAGLGGDAGAGRRAGGHGPGGRQPRRARPRGVDRVVRQRRARARAGLHDRRPRGKPLGAPFDGTGTGRAALVPAGAPGAGKHRGHRRSHRQARRRDPVRVLSGNPLFRSTSWIALAGDNLSETKLRTARDAPTRRGGVGRAGRGRGAGVRRPVEPGLGSARRPGGRRLRAVLRRAALRVGRGLRRAGLRGVDRRPRHDLGRRDRPAAGPGVLLPGARATDAPGRSARSGRSGGAERRVPDQGARLSARSPAAAGARPQRRAPALNRCPAGPLHG